MWVWYNVRIIEGGLIVFMSDTPENVKEDISIDKSDTADAENIKKDTDVIENMTSVLDDFSDNKIGTLYNKPISSGIASLDEILNGGFSSGLILIGAQPSMGKSTLALQIAQNIAKRGIPAYYYSIEMNRHSIAAKALARTIFSQSSSKISIPANSLMTANDLSAFSSEEWKAIKQAQEELSKVFNNFYVIESLDKAPVSGKQIYEQMSKQLKSEGQKNVIVFVDYLQLLSYPSDSNDARQPDMRAVVDANLNYLKALASECNIPVVIISSLNRSNNGSPVQTSDFKESGNIEYSADVLMAMQFTNTPERKKNTDYFAFFQKEKAKAKREIDLIVLKQRYGSSGYDTRVSFDYYPANDFFTVAGTTPETFNTPDIEWKEHFTEVESPYSDAPENAQERKRYSLPPSEKLPGRFYINNCNAIKKFYKVGNIKEGEKITVNVTNNKKPKTCTIFVYNDVNFTYYDSIVCDAVSTLWEYYKRANLTTDQVKITVNDVLACMTGKDKIRVRKAETSHSRENELIEILEKLGSVDITIDLSKELSLRKEKTAEYISRRPILPVKRILGSNNFILDLSIEPPFYKYASDKHQVISLEMKYLAIKPINTDKNSDDADNPKRRSNTDIMIKVKHLLNWRIAAMKHPRNKMTSNIIKYYYPSHEISDTHEGFCSTLGIGIKDGEVSSETALNNKIRHIHKLVIELLDEYIKMGYILGYDVLRAEKGKRVIGVRVQLGETNIPQNDE